jgi:hypothetical protein
MAGPGSDVKKQGELERVRLVCLLTRFGSVSFSAYSDTNF